MSPARALLAAVLLSSCSRAAPPARLPTRGEAGEPLVVVNYAPARLRVFPLRQPHGQDRYLVLGSERPELHAVWRPLGVSDQPPPPDFAARAGVFAWVDGHVLATAVADGQPRAEVYDRDGKRAQARPLALPGPCTATAPALLQEIAGAVAGLLGCPAQDLAYLLTLDSAGQLRRSLPVPGAADTEVFLQAPVAAYLLAGRRVTRVAPDGTRTYGTVPPPGTRPAASDPRERGADTRDLVLDRGDLLVLDGAVGRAVRMDARQLGWRGELRFSVGPAVERLRAVRSGDRLLLVLAERTAPGADVSLFGLSLDLRGPAGRAGDRLLLGTGLSPSDHELVPIAGTQPSAAGALLVHTQRGNTGPLVALQRLSF